MSKLILIIAVLFGGCSTQVAEPWSCECDCEREIFKCKGATIESSFETR